jgi:uncharacterized protein YoxC
MKTTATEIDMSDKKELQTYVKRNAPSVRTQAGIVSSFVELRLHVNQVVPAAKLVTENVGRSVDVVTYDVSGMLHEQKALLSKIMKSSGWAPVLTTNPVK